MSLYKGHLLGGFAAYMVVIVVWSIWHNVFTHNFHGLLATLAGALFPDIDIRSKGQRLFFKIVFLMIVVSLFLNEYLPLVALLSFSVLPIIFPHRGLFHDTIFTLILTAAVAGFCMYLVPYKASTIITIAFFFFLGVLSHLILDKGLKRTFYR